MNSQQDRPEYIGFWKRVVAGLIDTVILSILALSMFWLLSILMGQSLEALLSDDEPSWLTWKDVVMQLFFFGLTVFFWKKFQSTPGKMLFSAIIVDEQTGRPPTIKQCAIRYIGFMLSLLPLGWGLISLSFNPRKQGYHDKMAKTLVIRKTKTSAALY